MMRNVVCARVLLLVLLTAKTCSAQFPKHRGFYLVDALRLVSLRQDADEQNTPLSLTESNLLGFWNSSWPSIVQQLNGKDELSRRAVNERPYIVSKKCADDIVRLVMGLSSREIWAWKMMDSSGKFPSGVLLGNLQWVGTYGECVNTSSDGSHFNKVGNGTVVRGNYCLMNIGNSSFAKYTLTGIHFGICIPQTCNSTDARALLNILLLGFTSALYATDAECTDNSELPLDAGAAAFIVILCILGLFLLLGTCLDCLSSRRAQQKMEDAAADDMDTDDEPLLQDVPPDSQSEIVIQSIGTNGMDSETLRTVRPAPEQSEGRLRRFLMSFSVLANAKKILCPGGEQNLQALHGIRFVSMTWVILGHVYIASAGVSSNILFAADLFKRFTFQVVANASVSVDTFFLLSGALVSFLLLKEMRAVEGPRNIRWLKFFFHRFLRLTPLYMMVLAFYTTLFKYFGSGPFWQRTSDEACQANWWTNFLYINNIVHSYNMCMAWTWYLANDMQYFLLSPIFIVLLYKWSLLGCIVVFIFMLTSSITTGVVTYVNNYPPDIPGLIQNISVEAQWFKEVYMAPWCRINPYLIGILLGYILYKTNCKLRLHSALVILLWCFAAVCNLSVLYGLWNVAKGNFLSPSVSALYASVHRTAWSIGVAWVILACATGNGGVVNELLSMPVIIPLSRLTYAAYLVHPIVISWYFGNLKVALFVDDVTMVFLFVGTVALSYLAAFVTSVACEASMINLERSFIRDRKSQ